MDCVNSAYQLVNVIAFYSGAPPTGRLPEADRINNQLYNLQRERFAPAQLLRVITCHILI